RDQAAGDGAADHAEVEQRLEHAREDGDDVEPHPFASPGQASSACSNQSATTTRPALRSTLLTASFVAGTRCSAPSVPEATQTSLAGRAITFVSRPRGLPDSVTTSRPTSSNW